MVKFTSLEKIIIQKCVRSGKNNFEINKHVNQLNEMDTLVGLELGMSNQWDLCKEFY